MATRREDLVYIALATVLTVSTMCANAAFAAAQIKGDAATIERLVPAAPVSVQGKATGLSKVRSVILAPDLKRL